MHRTKRISHDKQIRYRHSDSSARAKDCGTILSEHLGFEITDDNAKMIGLHGKHINLFIEPGPPLGPGLEVTVDSVEKAKARLLKNGCEIVKDEPEFPRCYIKDPYGLIYNLTS